MSSGRIFLDLDGPVLDVSERYHRLHCDVVLARGGRPLDREDYWQAKRDQVPEAEILARAGLSSADINSAAAQRLREVETPGYLRLDRPWPWTAAVLEELARFAPLVLVTLRRHPDRLARQLDDLGLERRFDQIVAGAGDDTPEAKASLLRAGGWDAAAGSVFVGDTEVDVAGGRALGFHTIALRCGIRSPARLEVCEPDSLLDDLRDVPGHLRELGWAYRGGS
ncbi:MAG TPA: HAD family hydrolase [Thermoanaerobaculia bacterium]